MGSRRGSVAESCEYQGPGFDSKIRDMSYTDARDRSAVL